jgi:hypothetical protein
MQRKLLGASSADFEVTGQLLIKYLEFVKYSRKNRNAMRENIQTSEVLHNILIEFGIPMKPGRLRKMCLNESYNTVRVSKHMSDTFPTTHGMKQAHTL